MRKTKTVTIKALTLDEVKAALLSGGADAEAVNAAKAEKPGRDEGKVFLLTEMPAIALDKWASRAVLALGRSDLSGSGVMGLLSMGMVGIMSAISRLSWADAEPLMDDLLGCVQYQASLGVYRPINTGADLEEVLTFTKLRWEVLKLHFDFLNGDGN